jgi:NMT1-like family
LRAEMEGIGFTIARDIDIWDGHPGKVLGCRADWAAAYPNTFIALTKALLDACQYCGDPANAQEIRAILARKEYLGTSMDFIHLGGPQDVVPGVESIAHHVFSGEGVNRPSRTEHLWHMVEMARWGDVPFPRNWVEVLEHTCTVGVFSTAARELGLTEISYNRGSIQLVDGTTFNTDDPIRYLNELAIKRDVTMAEIPLNASRSVLVA